MSSSSSDARKNEKIAFAAQLRCREAARMPQHIIRQNEKLIADARDRTWAPFGTNLAG